LRESLLKELLELLQLFVAECQLVLGVQARLLVLLVLLVLVFEQGGLERG
jgi:hypothetical protein